METKIFNSIRTKICIEHKKDPSRLMTTGRKTVFIVFCDEDKEMVYHGHEYRTWFSVWTEVAGLADTVHEFIKIGVEMHKAFHRAYDLVKINQIATDFVMLNKWLRSL